MLNQARRSVAPGRWRAPARHLIQTSRFRVQRLSRRDPTVPNVRGALPMARARCLRDEPFQRSSRWPSACALPALRPPRAGRPPPGIQPAQSGPRRASSIVQSVVPDQPHGRASGHTTAQRMVGAPSPRRHESSARTRPQHARHGQSRVPARTPQRHLLWPRPSLSSPRPRPR
jgi:hypothetical protein